VIVAGVVAGTTACASQQGMSAGDVTPSGSSLGDLTSAGMMFTDPSIAAVGSASNQDEIQTSRLALERASDARVKAFAQRMIDDHSRVEQQMQSMLQLKGMVPVDNALSLQMKRNLAQTLEELRSRSGAEFDREYMAEQVADHDMTLKTLDTSLIPECDDAQMKSYLRDTVRPAVAMHLQDAKQLHDALMMQH
jgi:putative membrane protein